MKAKILSSIKSSPLILTHVFPDPDALGSAFGLAMGLSKLGKKAKVYIPQGVIPTMSNLIDSDFLVEKLDLSQFDCVVIVDTANKERASGLEEVISLGNLETINIDHHQSNNNWADSNYVDADSPATAVIIYELLVELGLEQIGVDISNLLLSGLVDDTGSFRFSNSNPRAFNVAAKLVEQGAEPEKISNLLYFSQSLAKLKLQAKAVDNLRLFHGGKIALVTVTQELLDHCGALASDTEGLVDVARSVDGVLVAAFMREHDSKWKVSLRSKSDDISVNAVANVYSGGGHRAAAGCTIEGELSAVEKKLITSIKRFIDA